MGWWVGELVCWLDGGVDVPGLVGWWKCCFSRGPLTPLHPKKIISALVWCRPTPKAIKAIQATVPEPLIALIWAGRHPSKRIICLDLGGRHPSEKIIIALGWCRPTPKSIKAIQATTPAP